MGLHGRKVLVKADVRRPGEGEAQGKEANGEAVRANRERG